MSLWAQLARKNSESAQRQLLVSSILRESVTFRGRKRHQKIRESGRSDADEALRLGPTSGGPYSPKNEGK